MDRETVKLIVSITGCVTGIIGLLLSILSIKRNRTIAVHEFLSKMESSDFITARKRVYRNTYTSDCSIEDEDASKVVNIFHHWGLLAKNIIFRCGFLTERAVTEHADCMKRLKTISKSAVKFIRMINMLNTSNGYIKS